MLKLRSGNQIINLIKSAKGSYKPGHKYCKREPAADGSGFKYWYAGESGRCGGEDNYSEDLSHVQAKKRHPEHYDASRPRFNVDEEASKIINFSSYAQSDEKIFGSGKKAKTFKQEKESLKEKYSTSQHQTAEGFLNEAVHFRGKEIALHKVDTISDLVKNVNAAIRTYSQSNDDYSKEQVRMGLSLLVHIAALSELPQETVGGAARLERTWKGALVEFKRQYYQLDKTFPGIKEANIRVRHSGHDVGVDRRADIYFEVKDKSGNWRQSGKGASLKAYSDEGGAIPLVTTGPVKGLELITENSSNDVKEVIGKVIKNFNRNAAKFSKNNYPNMPNKERAQEIQYRVHRDLVEMMGLLKGKNATEEDKDRFANFASSLIAFSKTLHHDPKSDNLAFSLQVAERKTGKASYYGTTANTMNKVIDKRVSSNKVSITVSNQGRVFESITGEKIPVYGDITLMIGSEKALYAELRHSRFSFAVKTPVEHVIGVVREGNKRDDGTGYVKEVGEYEGLSLSRLVNLFKSSQTTERQKMNSKYIRKELTESGKVRYIYKETNPRTKKVEEQEPVRRNQFNSTVDSVDPAYKALFEDSCQEIADEHFVNINAGCSSIRFTKDVDVFLDVLSVPQELRDNEEFTNASGSFNVSKGKMAFCTTNFPDDVSEVVKKAVMMHEVGHAYFYGTLRIKAKKPLTSDSVDSKDKDQKDFVKNSTKFVDTFGKMDEELRKKAEFDIEGVKGADKETLLQESIKTYMVSDYATLSGEEHFAEAFSRYFIMPEQLKKKEKEVYDHFESFFQKYGE